MRNQRVTYKMKRSSFVMMLLFLIVATIFGPSVQPRAGLRSASAFIENSAPGLYIDFGILFDLVSNKGISASSLSRPITAEYLQNCVFLVMTGETVLGIGCQPYSSAEIDEIKSWVFNGGSLLVLGWGNGNLVNQALNPLANEFGINFNDGCLLDSTHNYNSDPTLPLIHVFSANPLTAGLTQVLFNHGCTLTSSGQTSSIGFSDGDSTPANSPVLAYVAFGNGKVCGISDIPAVHDWGAPFDNVKLVQNIVDWCCTSVPTGDFEVSVSTSSKTALPHAATSFTVTVTSLNGFSSPVALSSVVDSAELTATFSSSTVTPPAHGSTQSTMKVSVLSTELKTHTILIYGISGTLSHFVSVNLGVRFLSVPYYYQGDTGWCAPTSVAMVAKYYGISVHPWDVAEAMGQGHDEGTLFADIIINYLAKIGLSGTEKDANFDEIKAMLDANKPVIIGVMWTLKHAFVITGYLSTPSDAILYVNDPSGYLFTYLNSGGADYEYKNPYVQDAVLWSDLVGTILPGSFIIGVSGNGHTPNPSSGTLSLVGGGDYNSPTELQTIKVKHIGSAPLTDVYIWESGWETSPILDTLGLTWRNSPTHSRSLDPSDFIDRPFDSGLIVNPTDELQNYCFEITFSKGGVQEWTSGRLSSSVSSCSHADPPLANDLSIGAILSKSGQYTIKLFLYTSAGALIDEIDLPPISYVVRSLLTLAAHCPVYLDLYDEHGNCVGYNRTSGTVENQIDGAFWESNQTILVFNPSGTYRLEVTGTDNGTFTSETSWQDATGVTSIIADFNSTITENETQVYDFGANANVTLTNIISKTVVGQNLTSHVNATVADLGGPSATFDVSLYANGTLVGTQSALNVSGWNSATACFTWNTTGLTYGNYTLTASIQPNNNFTGGSVIVAGVGDLTGGTANLLDFVPNGKVDMKDVGLVARFFGQAVPPAPSNCDLTGPTAGVPDGIINMRDVGLVARYFGTSYTYP